MIKTLKIFLATFIFAASALAFQGAMQGTVSASAQGALFAQAGGKKTEDKDKDKSEPTDIQNNLCKGADLKFNSTENCDSDSITKSSSGLNDLITRIVNIFSVIVGIIAVIMIIYGGFRYITSGGDSGNVTSAKNTILYAIVGLVIVALAQFIVRFVLNQSTNLT